MSVYKNLLFVSGEGQTGRIDCGIQGVPEPVSKERLRGIRVFDISDIENPKSVANVQTCRGSHTHTVVTDPNDKENVYIYVSGSAGVRSADELPGCKDGPDRRSRHRAVPPRSDQGAARGAADGGDRQLAAHLLGPRAAATPRRTGSRWRAAAHALRWHRLALRRRPSAARPRQRCRWRTRVDRRRARQHGTESVPRHHRVSGHWPGRWRLRRLRPAARHQRSGPADSASIRPPTSTCRSGTRRRSATTAPRCCSPTSGAAARSRAAATPTSTEWGANALFTIDSNKKMQFKSYYKLPAPQTSFENCVAHNGSLIPDSRPRGDGAGLVSGRHLDLRLDRCRRSRRRSPTTIAVPSTRRG